MNKLKTLTVGLFAAALAVTPALRGTAQEKTQGDLADKLRALDARVFPADSEDAKKLPQMLSRDVQARRAAVNQRETEAWRGLKTKADWERYRDPRIKALRDSLGTFPPAGDLKTRVTRTIAGDGYRIENLVFESRPGLVVTANLYLPDPPVKSMPGILIIHSHHNPKTQGELQDMGILWARLGCAVLVPDQIDHGERRQHPFSDKSKYAGPFAVGRQDYYFRYNVANQLYLVGESLVGWMAHDMMRGVDVLLSKPGVDRKRIILLGSVAGGGDPAAVTAALDPRISAVAPFNFGGPQPETMFPLPADAEAAFNYAGGGSWESTRNLRLSARDGFLPWVIVGSVAPRGLIYAHEFAWDRDRDPVWKRFEKIYEWYGAGDHLVGTAGKGSVKGMAPESTHCNNIGAFHRRDIYPALKRWFDIPIPAKENQKRHPSDELACLTPEAIQALKPRPVHSLAAELGAARVAAARARLAALPAKDRPERLRQDWARLLGKVDAPKDSWVPRSKREVAGDFIVERFQFAYTPKDEPNIVIPAVLLLPRHEKNARLPVVVGVAQEGKAGFLRHRADVIAALLKDGVAVCLPDLRGTGETRPGGDSRGRTSAGTSLSASEWMLGQTLLGARLRDLRLVLGKLRTHPNLDAAQIALWGDSFAPVNADGQNLEVPWDAAKLPAQSEPLGGLLALLGALYEPDVRAVHARGGLSEYQSLLRSQFLYVPHDALVPGALTVGDLTDVAAALAPRPVRLEGLVDGLNRRVGPAELAKAYAPARAAYQATPERFSAVAEPGTAEETARWLLARVKGG
ncbi:MAG TPA: acetylxylan esterase [Gemmataceae bacterium]|nr:acetylxylan esterase [Gemmataceae bacterium]